MNSPIRTIHSKSTLARAVLDSNVVEVRCALNYLYQFYPNEDYINEPTGADPEKKLTIAHYAAISNDLDMLELAIDFHADLSLRDASNSTPLALAIKMDSHKCVMKLIEFGAIIDYPIIYRDGEWYNNLVTFAAAKNNVDLLEALRIAGYDLTSPESSSDYKKRSFGPYSSPFEVAIKNSAFEAADYLAKYCLLPSKASLEGLCKFARLTGKTDQVNYIQTHLQNYF